MDTEAVPQTLLEAIRYFADADNCHDFIVGMRWPEGVSCPHCDHQGVNFVSTRRIWKCRNCKKQFSAKVGTIMEDSPLGLDKWLPAIWMIVNDKNGISSYEVARGLGITQKSAWFMMHRIRLAMQSEEGGLLCGQVEADETFTGGKARNMHPGKRQAKGRGAVGKAVVMGLLERHGEARTCVISNTKRGSVQEQVKKHVEPGSQLFTDALKSYEGMTEYAHQVIDHAEAYVQGNVHTNGMENFWSLLKRAIKGTYVSVEPFHLFRYLDEQTFRFNARRLTDAERFVNTVSSVAGKGLTYKELIGEPS